jgi:uncharacterized membrane protein
MSTLISAIIWVHIVAGFAALGLMFVPLLSAKGSRVHRRFGRAYVVCMLAVAATAVIAAGLRVFAALDAGKPIASARFSVFLSFIALLAFTSAMHGVRVLKQKQRTGPQHSLTDLAAPGALLIASVAMMAWGFSLGDGLLTYFPLVGVLVAASPLRSQLSAPRSRAFWVQEHITGMVGSAIATVTAAVVVNSAAIGRVIGGVPSLVLWLTPTVIGTVVIVVMRRRYGGEKQGGLHGGEPVGNRG